MIVIDCETSPQEGVENLIEEPSAPSHYKDPAKIAAYIAGAKADLIEGAALSPFHGRILAIGCLKREPWVNDEITIIHGYDEKRNLTEFWEYYRKHREQGHSQDFVGFNSNSFDWPMLVKRSYANGIKPPRLVDQRGYLLSWLIDLRPIWNMGDRQAKGTLGEICQSCKIGRKTGSGAEFAKTYAEDPAKALKYLENDLVTLTASLADLLLS